MGKFINERLVTVFWNGLFGDDLTLIIKYFMLTDKIIMLVIKLEIINKDVLVFFIFLTWELSHIKQTNDTMVWSI